MSTVTETEPTTPGETETGADSPQPAEASGTGDDTDGGAPGRTADGLFDRSDYDREDLALPKVDGNQIDRIAVKFNGTVFLDRSSPADVALFRKLTLGHELTLQVEAQCSTTSSKGATDRDGDLDVIVGEKTVKVHTVYVPTLEAA